MSESVILKRLSLQKAAREQGNAIAAFVLIIPLVLFVLFALISLIYALHIRFLAEDAAFEGAKAEKSLGQSLCS